MTGAQSLARPSLLLSRPAARLKLLRTLPSTPPLWASRPRSSCAGECELSLVRWCIFPAPLKRVFTMVTPCEPKYIKKKDSPSSGGHPVPRLVCMHFGMCVSFLFPLQAQRGYIRLDRARSRGHDVAGAAFTCSVRVRVGGFVGGVLGEDVGFVLISGSLLL